MQKKKINTYLIGLTYLLGVVLLGSLCILMYFQSQLRAFGQVDKQDEKKYDKHYVLITHNQQSSLWDKVYESAKVEADKVDAYLEYMGDKSSNDRHVEALMKVAIACDVDGILVEGNNTSEMAALVDEAAAKGMPVVTVLSDSPGSKRKCYVGIEEAMLGKVYGEEILKMIKEEQKVTVLVDAEQITESKDIYNNMESILGQSIHIQPIDHSTLFGAEEGIRDIFVSNSALPDVIVCLNEIDTKCLYQAVIDYNKVGQVKILGYYSGPEVIEAIKKDIIYGTVAIDPQEIGRLSIEALATTSIEKKSPIHLQMITADNLKSYLKE